MRKYMMWMQKQIVFLLISANSVDGITGVRKDLHREALPPKGKMSVDRFGNAQAAAASAEAVAFEINSQGDSSQEKETSEKENRTEQPIDNIAVSLSADAEVSIQNFGLKSAGEIGSQSPKQGSPEAGAEQIRRRLVHRALTKAQPWATLNKLKEEDMSLLYGQSAIGFFSDQATAGLASMLQVPSEAEMQTLQSQILAKSPNTCNASLVSHACDETGTSATGLAQILQVPPNIVASFFSEAGITDAAPSCQDLCEKALQLIPAEGRPPRHYVGGIRKTPGGSIQWVIDMSPQALSSFGGKESRLPDNDVDNDVAKGTHANFSGSPTPGGVDTTVVGVATQICEMFYMFPYVNPIAGSLLSLGGSSHANVTWGPGFPRALPTNGVKVVDFEYCNGMNYAVRAGCKISDDGASCPQGHLPACVCWDREGSPYPQWPLQTQIVWYFAAVSSLLAKENFPDLRAKKRELIQQHFDFDYQVFCFDESDACKKAKLLDKICHQIWNQFWENTRLCYDAAIDPPWGITRKRNGYLTGDIEKDGYGNVITSYGRGLGGGGQGSRKGPPPFMAYGPDGWLNSDFKSRVEIMVHEHCHMSPLGLEHGQWKTLPDGEIVSGKVANCYEFAKFYRDLIGHWLST